MVFHLRKYVKSHIRYDCCWAFEKARIWRADAICRRLQIVSLGCYFTYLQIVPANRTQKEDWWITMKMNYNFAGEIIIHHHVDHSSCKFFAVLFMNLGIEMLKVRRSGGGNLLWKFYFYHISVQLATVGLHDFWWITSGLYFWSCLLRSD